MKSTARAIVDQSLPDQIADWLITEISEERLQPEQNIREQFVAEQCGVSRAPVREAFRIVEKIGLIRILPRKGAVVSPLDIDELRELFEIRAALVRVAVCLVIDRATDDQLQRLLSEVALLKSLAADEQEFYSASNKVGKALSELTDSRRLNEMLGALDLQILRYRHHGFSNQSARIASADGFIRVVEALVTRDKQASLEAVDSATGSLVAEVEKAFST